MIIRKRVRDFGVKSSCGDDEALFCRTELCSFFELGRTKLDSWDIVSSDEKPTHGLTTTVYETRPTPRYSGDNVDYKARSGGWKIAPYILASTRARLGLNDGKRYVWLEYRGRG